MGERLTKTQARVYKRIPRGGAYSESEIAGAAALRCSTVQRTLAELQRMGLVRRVVDMGVVRTWTKTEGSHG